MFQADFLRFISLISFPNLLSIANPINTKMLPSHCLCDIGLPNKNTEPNIVKNFRVVVIIEHVRGPNDVIVVNMKC